MHGKPVSSIATDWLMKGGSLEEDEIFNSSVRYQMPDDALLMDEADSVQHSRSAKPLFRFRYADVLLMKAEAMERNDGDGRAEYNMVRAHAGLPARKSSLANILEDRQVVLAGETFHRQDLIRFGKFLKSSYFAVLFSPLLRPVPSSSRYLSEVLPSMASWFRTKDMSRQIAKNSSPPETPINRGDTGREGEEINRDYN